MHSLKADKVVRTNVDTQAASIPSFSLKQIIIVKSIICISLRTSITIKPKLYLRLINICNFYAKTLLPVKLLTVMKTLPMIAT